VRWWICVRGVGLVASPARARVWRAPIPLRPPAAAAGGQHTCHGRRPRGSHLFSTPSAATCPGRRPRRRAAWRPRRSRCRRSPRRPHCRPARCCSRPRARLLCPARRRPPPSSAPAPRGADCHLPPAGRCATASRRTGPSTSTRLPGPRSGSILAW